jgi:hypothetical protein
VSHTSPLSLPLLSCLALPCLPLLLRMPPDFLSIFRLSFICFPLLAVHALLLPPGARVRRWWCLLSAVAGNTAPRPPNPTHSPTTPAAAPAPACLPLPACRKQFDKAGKLVDKPAPKPAASNGGAAMSTS